MVLRFCFVGIIPPPPSVLEESTADDHFSFLEKHFLMTVACVIILLLLAFIFILWFSLRKKKRLVGYLSPFYKQRNNLRQLINYLCALISRYFCFLLCDMCLDFINSRSEEVTTHAEERPHNEKTMDRDNRRNCQQVYTSSPIKSNEKLQDAAAGESTANRKTCPLFMTIIVCSHVRDKPVRDI